MPPYLSLAIAIVAEVIATSALRAAEGFTRLGPSLLVVVGYAIAFVFLSLTLKSIPIGIAYAIWSGLGIVLISLVDPGSAGVDRHGTDRGRRAGAQLVFNIVGALRDGVTPCFSRQHS